MSNGLILGNRILIVGPFAEGSLPSTFGDAFENLGWDVFRFDCDRAYFDYAQHVVVRRLFKSVLWNRVNRTTVEIVRTLRPSVVLVLKGAYLDPETIRHVRAQLGIPIVNYYPDNPFCGVPLDPRKTSAQRRDLLDALAQYTHVWIWEASLADRLRQLGVIATYLPFGVDPQLVEGACAPPARCEECDGTHAVVFVGQHSVKRHAHIKRIRRAQVSIWGNRWARAERSIGRRHYIHRQRCSGRRPSALYAAAGVSLNVVDDLNMPGHNMRTFEITGSGGLLLSSYTVEQDRFFPDGVAALYYRSPEELDWQIERVLGDRAFGCQLRSTARAMAAEHSYTARAASMLADLGIAGNSTCACRVPDRIP
jgi:hypothetical protein